MWRKRGWCARDSTPGAAVWRMVHLPSNDGRCYCCVCFFWRQWVGVCCWQCCFAIYQWRHYEGCYCCRNNFCWLLSNKVFTISQCDQIYQNLALFGETLRVWQFVWVYFVFWKVLGLLWQIFFAIGQFLSLQMTKILINKSSRLVTLPSVVPVAVAAKEKHQFRFVPVTSEALNNVRVDYFASIHGRWTTARSTVASSSSVCPDWAIYWTLGNFSKLLATINLHKSPTFLGNFCLGIKIFNFRSEKLILGNFYRHLVTFYWSHCSFSRGHGL